jgi:signal peptidase II
MISVAGARPQRLLLGLAIAGLVIVLDQLTKIWMMGLVLDPPRMIPVTGFFNLVAVWNRGVSFGLFSRHEAWNAWLLSGFATIVSVILVVWLHRTERILLALALGLVIGGALGNVIDRLRYGAVFDFLLFFVGRWSWPAFNLADSAITLGVGLLLLDGLFGQRGPGKSGV